MEVAVPVDKEAGGISATTTVEITKTVEEGGVAASPATAKTTPVTGLETALAHVPSSIAVAAAATLTTDAPTENAAVDTATAEVTKTGKEVCVEATTLDEEVNAPTENADSATPHTAWGSTEMREWLGLSANGFDFFAAKPTHWPQHLSPKAAGQFLRERHAGGRGATESLLELLACQAMPGALLDIVRLTPLLMQCAGQGTTEENDEDEERAGQAKTPTSRVRTVHSRKGSTTRLTNKSTTQVVTQSNFIGPVFPDGRQNRIVKAKSFEKLFALAKKRQNNFTLEKNKRAKQLAAVQEINASKNAQAEFVKIRVVSFKRPKAGGTMQHFELLYNNPESCGRQMGLQFDITTTTITVTGSYKDALAGFRKIKGKGAGELPSGWKSTGGGCAEGKFTFRFLTAMLSCGRRNKSTGIGALDEKESKTHLAQAVEEDTDVAATKSRYDAMFTVEENTHKEHIKKMRLEKHAVDVESQTYDAQCAVIDANINDMQMRWSTRQGNLRKEKSNAVFAKETAVEQAKKRKALLETSQRKRRQATPAVGLPTAVAAVTAAPALVPAPSPAPTPAAAPAAGGNVQQRPVEGVSPLAALAADEHAAAGAAPVVAAAAAAAPAAAAVTGVAPAADEHAAAGAAPVVGAAAAATGVAPAANLAPAGAAADAVVGAEAAAARTDPAGANTIALQQNTAVSLAAQYKF